jgi:hypothetical protein
MWEGARESCQARSGRLVRENKQYIIISAALKEQYKCDSSQKIGQREQRREKGDELILRQ